jgi:hypothetical protein
VQGKIIVSFLIIANSAPTPLINCFKMEFCLWP